MDRNFQVVDLIDSKTGRFVGQALYCNERNECPFYTANYSRIAAGEILEAFVAGAKEVEGSINLTHINMPIKINTNTPYNEIRNTIVGEMEMRTTRVENSENEQKEG